MTDPITVTLDIRAGASNGSDGFTNTTCNDGTIYCYKWTDGTDGEGNVLEHLKSGGAADINIHSMADARFILINTELSAGTTQFQISITDSWNARIHDIGTANEDDYFKLQFKDTIEGHNSRTFWCDPKIKNSD